MVHPSERGHFYDRDGNPVYEVPYADPSKGMRAVTLADARKLNLLPSVTTILQEAAKPGLERWKVTQGVLSALTLPKLANESLDDFAGRAIEDSREQAKKAAERGTAIHAAVQNHYQGGKTEEAMRSYVEGAVERINAAFGATGWLPEGTIARKEYAGKRDLRAPGVTLDLKTTLFSDATKRLAWDEHCIQLAAYREPQDRCANVFISVNNPGLVHIHEWKEAELERGWKMFQALLDYWYARTGLKR